MWTRKELKERAKAVLKNIYWKAFGVSIVIALAGGNTGNGNRVSSTDHISSNNGNIFPHLMSFLPIFIGVGLLCIALRIFLGYCLEVGGRRYFVQSAQYRDNRRCFKFAFHAENYQGIVSAMFRKDIQNLLWYLLLIIPGIVKFYAYRMVPFILADNPHIGSKEAIALSNRMTYGHKSAMFVLDLSFIGWYILGTLALLIGVLFVMPYQDATEAELYLELRRLALENGECSYDDFGLDHPIPVE